MTEFEKRQPARVFISAGRKAYHALIHVSANPYKQEPYRDLWEKGWRFARKAEDSKRPGYKAAPVPKQEVAHDRKRRPRPLYRRETNAGVVTTEKLVARFNRRNRTIA